MGPDLRFSFITGRNVEIMGGETESIIGHQLAADLSRITILSRSIWLQHLQTLEAHQPFTEFEIHWTRPDGQERYISISGKPFSMRRAASFGYRGVGRDISRPLPDRAGAAPGA